MVLVLPIRQENENWPVAADPPSATNTTLHLFQIPLPPLPPTFSHRERPHITTDRAVLPQMKVLHDTASAKHVATTMEADRISPQQGTDEASVGLTHAVVLKALVGTLKSTGKIGGATRTGSILPDDRFDKTSAQGLILRGEQRENMIYHALLNIITTSTTTTHGRFTSNMVTASSLKHSNEALSSPIQDLARLDR